MREADFFSKSLPSITVMMSHCSPSARDAMLFGNMLQEFINVPLISLEHGEDFRTAIRAFIL
jgi:hypothetical protein